MPTPDLIDRLAAGLTPVRRLRNPVIRATEWLLLATVVAVALVLVHGVRPDFRQSVLDGRFVLCTGASVATGICASIAAFMLGLPDRSRAWALLPLPVLAVWVSTIGYQCLTDWIALDPNRLSWGEAAGCFSTLVLASLPLAITILVMLRHSAPLRPVLATLTAGLAVSAITATVLSLIHNPDAGVMVLVWNLGTVGVLIAVSGTIGRRLMRLAFARGPGDRWQPYRWF
jgi:hypothetical protein